MLVGIIIFLVIIMGISILRDRIKEHLEIKAYSRKQQERVQVQPKFDVEGEILATLREMNCIPESKPCGNGADIQFTCQGENLLIRTDGDYRIAKIVDPYWYEVEQSDIDRFAEVRKAINQVNKDLIGTTLFYNFNERDHKFHVSSIDRIIAASDPNETRHSIEAAVGGFFRAHRYFERELLNQNVQNV